MRPDVHVQMQTLQEKLNTNQHSKGLLYDTLIKEKCACHSDITPN